MKPYRLVHAITVTLDSRQTTEYFKTFGQDGWLDFENIILKQCSGMSHDEITKYETFFPNFNLKMVDYLIIHLT